MPPPADPAFDTPPAAIAANAYALEEWTHLAPMLRRAKQITLADRAALMAACLEWARYLAAIAALQREGFTTTSRNGYATPNPHLSIATKALTGCLRLWAELGLTPSSRSRVTTGEEAGPGPEGDAFSEFDDPAEAAH